MKPDDLPMIVFATLHSGETPDPVTSDIQFFNTTSETSPLPAKY